MIENVTFDTLPKVIMELYREVVEMKKMIRDQKNVEVQPMQVMTVDDAARFLKLSRQTIYGLVSQRAIPYMKQGKRLYFTTEELTVWLKSGRKEIPHRLPKFESARRTAA